MLGEMVEGKQKKRQSKNRSCVHKGMVYEAENLSWNYMKPVKKISFETQHCAILVGARSNQNVSRGLKCLKHEDTYWPIQYLRGKKNYGKIFFQEYMHEPNSSLAYLYMGPNPALGYLWQLCILQT